MARADRKDRAKAWARSAYPVAHACSFALAAAILASTALLSAGRAQVLDQGPVLPADVTDVRNIFGKDDQITLQGMTRKIGKPVRPELKDLPAGTPVDVISDRIVYDRNTGIATAIGDVQLTYGPYVLNATKVVYDPKRDRLQANGSVVVREPSGNVLVAETVELEKRLRDGFARYLKLLLTNKSTITAEYAERRDGNITVYERTAYTACQDCTMANGQPVWQIKAEQSIHNENTHIITHKGAEFELFGLSIGPLPFDISMADPLLERKSGFLTPRVISSRDIGVGVEIPYYWALAPDYDLTLLPALTTKQGLLARAQWRQRLANGEYYVDGAGIYQLDKDIPAPGDRRFRGFIRSEGRFELNQNWHWGWDVTATSDQTFMRRYDIDKRTDLVSQLYMEGIDDRNYFRSTLYNFQGLLKTDKKRFTPYLVPQILHEYTYDEPVLGGQVSIDTNFYSLHRKDPTIPFPTVYEAQDATRVVSELEWRRRLVTHGGLVATPFAVMRADATTVRNLPSPNVPSGLYKDETTGRLLPTAGLDLRMPFIRTDSFAQHVVTPVVQIITSSNETKANRFSNEDAVTVNLDHTNIFLSDRFTGKDRFEGGTRANIGATYSMLLPEGGWLKTTLGQSFHLAGRNSFAPGSGLNGDSSDVIAAIQMQPNEHIAATYVARFDDKSMEMNAQELGIAASYERLTAALNYSDVLAAPRYGRPADVEQIWASGSVNVWENWRVFGGFRYDITNDRQVRNVIGIGWDCDCMSVSLAYAEDFTRDRDVDQERSVILSVSFRTLGAVKASIGID